MKIYLVLRTDDVGWDESEGFVVCAEDEDDARDMAAEGDTFGPDGVWHGNKVTVSEVLPGERRVVLESFKAG